MSEWEMPEIIAIQKWVAKKIPNYSTGIDESLTCGYGELDELGFWEYPLPPEFHGKVPAQEHELKLLREAVGLISTLKPDMVIDALNPLGIARQVKAHVQAERDAMQKRVRELEAAIRIGSEEIHKDDGDYALGMKTLIEAIGGKYPAADYKTEPTTIADIIAQHKKGPQRGRRG